MQTEPTPLSSLTSTEQQQRWTNPYSHSNSRISNRLNWLHLETEPLHWLGLIRAIAEPRLPHDLTLNLQKLNSLDHIEAAWETDWKVISCVHLIENAPLQWHTLFQLREAFPHAIRVVFAPPSHPHPQLRLLEAGANWLIPDALTLCHWLPKWIETEYPHR